MAACIVEWQPDNTGLRGVDISHQTVRFWWHRFGPIFAAEIRKRRMGD